MMRATTLALVLAACAEPIPDTPTWSEHVRPILQANCIRCHGLPAQGGAPTGFRLDKYDDTTLLDGTVVRGARTMARFIAVRAGELGDMPPDWPRTDAQRDTLIRWADQAGPDGVPALGDGRANAEPTAVALALPTDADDTVVAIRTEIADADGDLVDGELLVGGVVVSTDLRSGRGLVAVDRAVLPPGDHDVVAHITDDLAVASVNLGTLPVAHAGDNTGPRMRVTAPARDAIIHDSELPFAIEIGIDDPDPPATVDIVAFRDDEEIPVATGVPVLPGPAPFDASATFLWTDTSALGDGHAWRLRVIADEVVATTEAISSRFVISHAPDGPAFASVVDIFSRSCSSCHQEIPIPGINDNFSVYDDEPGGARGVHWLRGRIYRHVVLQRTCPPVSSASLGLPAFVPLSDADRAALAEYHLGGTQP